LAQTLDALQTSSRRDTRDAGDPTRRLGLGFLALAGATYALVVLGALVRAHGAGLACPDWPLCFGELVPQFDFRIAFEWGHRALAGGVALIFSALSLRTLQQTRLRGALLPGVVVTGTLLAIQIVLGGLTVLQLLASWTVTSHLVIGNAFALALVLLGRRLLALAPARAGDARPAESTPSLARLPRAAVTLAGALLFVQIVLGGLVSSSYAGLACPDWPTCVDGELFPGWTGVRGLHVLHRTMGYALVLTIFLAAGVTRHHRPSRRWLGVAAVLAVLQVGVGVANVLLRIPVEVTGLHSALAAALCCTVGVGVREAWRGSSAAGAVRPPLRD
jgi:cytochrome c oxidase assembly protein subunit 15